MANDKLQNQNSKEIAVMNERMKGIECNISEIKKSLDGIVQRLDDAYVTKVEFQPVRAVVYGLVGLILTAVTSTIIYVVIK